MFHSITQTYGPSKMPCLGDPLDHGVNGLGNQLMAAMSTALVAHLFDKCIVIQSPLLRAAFHLPTKVLTVFPAPFTVLRLPGESITRLSSALSSRIEHYETRWWWIKDHFKDEIKERFNVTHVEQAMHAMGAWLFSTPRASISKSTIFLMRRYRIGAALHLRTFSDAKCPLGNVPYGDCGQCVPHRSVSCINQVRLKNAVVFGDSPSLIEKVTRSTFKNESTYFGRDTSKMVASSRIHDTNAMLDPMVVWNTLRLARVRVVSSTSTFSKSVVLVSGIRRRDMMVDLRCEKDHRSDGDLFTCRRVVWQDLV